MKLENIFYFISIFSFFQNVLECESPSEMVDVFLNGPQWFLSLSFSFTFFSVRVVMSLETMTGHLVTDLMIKLSNAFFVHNILRICLYD